MCKNLERRKCYKARNPSNTEDRNVTLLQLKEDKCEYNQSLIHIHEGEWGEKGWYTLLQLENIRMLPNWKFPVKRKPPQQTKKGEGIFLLAVVAFYLALSFVSELESIASSLKSI